MTQNEQFQKVLSKLNRFFADLAAKSPKNATLLKGYIVLLSELQTLWLHKENEIMVLVDRLNAVLKNLQAAEAPAGQLDVLSPAAETALEAIEATATTLAGGGTPPIPGPIPVVST